MAAQTPAGREAKARPNLSKGFDALTLNPAPRLRRARRHAMKSDPLSIGWSMTGQSMVSAVRTVTRSLSSTSK